MKILDYGSLNLDFVYSVDHIVKPGETISSGGMNIFAGGKGLNQAIALSKACEKNDLEVSNVYMAGCCGSDGSILRRALEAAGVNVNYLKDIFGPNGNATIQVSANGENAIVLYGGSNLENTKQQVNEVLFHFEKDDVLVLQNEINLVDYIVEKGFEKGMKIVLNPSPYNEKLNAVDFSKVDLFFVNEVEAQQITGFDNAENILDAMEKKFPHSGIVLTLGKNGAVFSRNGERISHGIYKVPVVDTTAAGDTFTGFFTQAYYNGKYTAAEALELASKASSIAVSRKGASPSIPSLKEVLEYTF